MSDDSRRVLIDRKLSDSSAQHVIQMAFEQVDVAGWLFSLPNVEYQRCCVPDHLACGFATDDNRRPVVIHVETVAGSLVVQQYVAHVHRPDCCELVSVADVFPLTGGRTSTQMTWRLTVEAVDDDRSCCTNRVIAYATEDFMRYLERTGTSFEEASAARQAGSADHTRRETRCFAESLARWSRTHAALGA